MPFDRQVFARVRVRPGRMGDPDQQFPPGKCVACGGTGGVVDEETETGRVRRVPCPKGCDRGRTGVDLL